MDSVAEIPFDDVFNEGPHSLAKRIIDRTRRATWPWIASSMRVKQNLRDVETFGAGQDLQKVCNTWGQVCEYAEKHPI